MQLQGDEIWKSLIIILCVLLTIMIIGCDKKKAKTGESGADITTDNSAKSSTEIDDKNQKLSLIDIVKRDNITEVKSFISPGIDIDLKDKYGNTVLIYASEIGNIEIVTLLITNGADFDIKNKDNKTALIIAKENNHIDVVEYLKNIK